MDYYIHVYAKFPLTASTKASVECYNQCIEKYIKEKVDLDDMGFYDHQETLESAFGCDLADYEERGLTIRDDGESKFVLVPIEMSSLSNLQKLKDQCATKIILVTGECSDDEYAFAAYEDRRAEIIKLHGPLKIKNTKPRSLDLGFCL